MPKQDDAIMSKAAQVDVMPSADPRQERRHPLGWSLIHSPIELSKRKFPPGEVAAAVAARHTPVCPHGQIHAATAPQEVFGDLAAGRSGADDQDGSRWQFVRVMVAAGVNL